MTTLSLRFQNVDFAYERSTQPIVRNLSLHVTSGWTGIVGANGAGKSTILKLATGLLGPQRGRVTIPEVAIYCQQRTDNAPPGLIDLICSMEREAFGIKGRLGVEDDWTQRWSTLSHGERKRAQIAVAIWRKPQVLAVDEPTNHLDAEAQDLLFGALSTFSGIGLLVSHDRKLLDALCHQCLFVDPPQAMLRPGNYSTGMQQAKADEKTAQKQRTRAKQDFLRLKREAARRRTAASQADGKRSKQGLVSKDHDAREKINLARVTGKDGSGKSTLVGYIIQSLNLNMNQITYIPQEIDNHASRDIMARARNLPNEKLGQMMTVVSCLGSRPQRLLESMSPSPGEIRKLLLAIGIANVPHLIVMDEPTNHLDLPSIECLEQALADCPCGLLLVSHDQRFLRALTDKRWHISEDMQTPNNYILEIQ